MWTADGMSDEEAGHDHVYMRWPAPASIERWHAYALLAVTVLLETGATCSMKLATVHYAWHILAYALYAMAFGVFPRVLNVVELSVAYAVWSGMGCILTAIVGWLAFAETLNTRQLASIVVILAGVVGLLL